MPATRIILELRKITAVSFDVDCVLESFQALCRSPACSACVVPTRFVEVSKSCIQCILWLVAQAQVLDGLRLLEHCTRLPSNEPDITRA